MTSKFALLRRVSAAVLLGTGTLLAVTATLPMLVSISDPLAATCDASGGSETTAGERDWETEPTLVVNPTDARNLITAWTQDFSDAIVAAYSLDAGRSWHQTVITQKFCTSTQPDVQQWTSAYDSMLAFARNGTAYLSSVLISGTGSAAAVNISYDKGRTWPRQVLLDDAQGIKLERDDHTTIVADPLRPQVVYVGWDRISGTINGVTGGAQREPYLSRTTDGGQRWSAPIRILARANYVVPPGLMAFFHTLLPQPDGTLVDLFSLISAAQDPQNVHGPVVLMATTSNDMGETWSTPAQLLVSSDTTLPLFGSAVAPNGVIHLAWQRAGSPTLPTTTSIMHMTATRLAGGVFQTTAPTAAGSAVNERPMTVSHRLLAPPQLAYRDNRTLAVMFYDHRKNDAGADPNEPPHKTDLWLRFSSDGGLSWPDAQERHVAGSFNIGTAPDTDGYTRSCNIDCQPQDGPPGPTGTPSPHTYGNGFIGDYWGFVPYGSGFAMAFAETNPQLPQLPHNTDIYFATVSPDTNAGCDGRNADLTLLGSNAGAESPNE
ncbi:MAG TPA: hypothetical protein VF511_04195 [Chthoniobacterales bacterium]